MPGEPALVAALEARLTKFEKQLKDAGTIADREVSRIEKRFSKLNPSSSFLSNFAKGAIGAFSLERAVSGVLSAIEKVAKIGDIADRVGVTAEQLQELQYALRQSGGEADQAGPALERFSVAISKAASGGSPLAKFLRDNSVALRDQNGNLRSNAELLSEVANLIQNAATPQERLNIAAQFFGRQAGPAMAAALSNGAAGLNKLAQEGRDAGAVLRNEMVKEAQRLDDQWDKLVDTFTKKGQSAIISGVQKVQEFLNKVDEWATRVLPILQAINKFNPVQIGLKAAGFGGSEFDDRFHFGDGIAKGPAKLTVTPNSGRRTNTRALGTEARKDELAREIEQVQKNIAVMNAEAAVFDKGAVARDKARVVAELHSAAIQVNTAAGLKNTAVTAEQKKRIDEVAAAYETARAKIEEANGPLRQFARDAADVNKQLQEATVDGLRGLEDGLISIIDGTKSASEAFRTMTNAIIADLARIAIRQSITGPLASAFSSIFGGFRAAGGPVSPNRAYMVGENGPELVVPKQAGTVIPNKVLRSGGSGNGGVVVHFSPVIDARGADQATVVRLGAVVKEMQRTMTHQIDSRIMNRQLRGVRA